MSKTLSASYGDRSAQAPSNGDAASATGAPAAATAAVPSLATRLSGKGLAAAAGAFVVWGVLPMYLKPLHEIPALEVIAHRVLWSCLFILAWMLIRGELGTLTRTLRQPGILARLMISAALVSVNWITYVWAVGHGHVVESSLGYFINPLVNVLLGVVILRERLNRAQWTAIALAALGVAYLTVMAGRPPWIALTLALSFGLYGLVRKVISVAALPGLATETLLLLPFAAGYLVWCEATGTGLLGHTSRTLDALLVGCGPVTAVPLFLFAYGARLIPYSTVGLLQYIAPTLQLACGLLAFHEPFERTRAVGFVVIWLALAVYAGDSLWRARRSRPA